MEPLIKQIFTCSYNAIVTIANSLYLMHTWMFYSMKLRKLRNIEGEMAEWFKATVLKAVSQLKLARGFKSLSLRLFF